MLAARAMAERMAAEFDTKEDHEDQGRQGHAGQNGHGVDPFGDADLQSAVLVQGPLYLGQGTVVDC